MKRLISLDILRGLTIFCMIVVNTPGPGGAAGMLTHCTWNGCSVADLVFPFFIFIVGASIFFAMRKSEYRLDWRVALTIIKRSALIFLVGYLLNVVFSGKDLADVRIMAALQRIAIVYLLAAFSVLLLKKTSYIAVLTAFLLGGYWALVHFTGAYELNADNPIAAFDAALLGGNRMYSIAGVVFDPEGLVGTIPALGSALIGYMVAILISKKGFLQTFFVGALLFGAGLVWALWFPLNKPLWSSSFVLYTCGLASMLWATLHYICDVKGYVSWGYFFKVFGVNAIACYVISEAFAMLNWSMERPVSGWLFDNVYGGFFAGWVSSLTWAMIVVAATWLVAWPLARKKIYIKL